MLFLLGAGSGVHLFLLPYGQDYPTITRLFEIAAFPFLLLLPGRAAVETGLDLGGRAVESGPIEDRVRLARRLSKTADPG